MEAPVILQSMYIFKNPEIGGVVVPHQDSTFLHTEPNSFIGLWFPLDDATLENGCLWFIPGSHTSGDNRRYTRNPDSNSSELLIFDRPPVKYPSPGFSPYPCPKGSCVVIYGNVVHFYVLHVLHFCEANKSSKSRRAHTFHIMDATSKYSPENWLQSPNGFPLVYSD